jgi:hypothetical protein
MNQLSYLTKNRVDWHIVSMILVLKNNIKLKIQQIF